MKIGQSYVMSYKTKIRKVLDASDRAHDIWFKNYWWLVANYLIKRHKSIHGDSLIDEKKDEE